MPIKALYVHVQHHCSQDCLYSGRTRQTKGGFVIIAAKACSAEMN